MRQGSEQGVRTSKPSQHNRLEQWQLVENPISTKPRPLVQMQLTCSAFVEQVGGYGVRQRDPYIVADCVDAPHVPTVATTNADTFFSSVYGAERDDRQRFSIPDFRRFQPATGVSPYLPVILRRTIWVLFAHGHAVKRQRSHSLTELSQVRAMYGDYMKEQNRMRMRSRSSHCGLDQTSRPHGDRRFLTVLWYP